MSLLRCILKGDPYDASVWIELSCILKMNNGGLNNAAFYDDSSDEEFMMDGENHGWNRAEGPVRLLAHRRQLPAVPAPPPIHTAPIAIGTYHLVFSCIRQQWSLQCPAKS